MEWKGRRAVLYWGAHPSHPNLHLLTGLGFALRRRAGLQLLLALLLFVFLGRRKFARAIARQRTGRARSLRGDNFLLNQSSRPASAAGNTSCCRSTPGSLTLAPPRKAERAGSRPRARPDIQISSAACKFHIIPRNQFISGWAKPWPFYQGQAQWPFFEAEAAKLLNAQILHFPGNHCVSS